MISADLLGDALGLGRVPDEELVGILGGVFPLSRWESGKRVSYFHPEQGHVLDVVYGKHGRVVSFEAGPGLTDELVATLRERAKAALAPDAGWEVRRDVLFSVPEVKGSGGMVMSGRSFPPHRRRRGQDSRWASTHSWSSTGCAVPPTTRLR